MNIAIFTIALLTLFVSALAAAWPLLLLPRLRPALARVGGTSCITLGSAIMALLTTGFLQLPGSASCAYADDKNPAPAKAEVESSDPIIESTTTVEIPPGRPKWIGSEPNFRGKIHTIPVASGPYKTDSQSKRALNEALVKATNEYIAEQLGSELAPKLIRYDARTIHERFVKKENEYHDTARYSDPVGYMHEHFALLEFDTKFRNDLDSRWTKVRATSRLAQTGLVSGAALLLLASVFGYFRLDNVTRGYYTGRLQFMTAAAILAVVGVGAALSQWIHWL
jgi:hypothetical protein